MQLTSMRLPIVVMAAGAVALMSPALIWGAPGIDSAAFNYVWTKQFAQELARGELYPRWLPNSFEGVGSPTFYFYPPLAYYLSAFFDLAGLPTLRAIAAAAAVLTSASGVSMFLWLRSKTRYALIGACLYMAAPYHLTDFYVRAALAEFSSFVWLPLIALAIEAQPRRWALPVLALAYAALILSHLPMTVLATFGLIGPFVLWRAYRERDLAIATRSLAAGVVGIALAAIYLLPALTLQTHLSTNILWGPLYQPASWLVFAPAPGVPTGILYAFASLAMGLALLAVGARRGLWTWIAVSGAILSLGIPPFLWSLPIMEQVQFPWRVLAIVEFAAITGLLTSPLRMPFLIAAMLLVGVSVSKFTPAAVKAFANEYPADIDQAMPDAPEYLPPSFHTPGTVNYEFRPDLSSLRGPLVRGPVTNVSSSPDGAVRFETTAPGPVIVRRASFPAWRVFREGQEVPLTPGPLVSFDAQPGSHEVRRVPLPQEKIGLAISTMAALALLLYALFPGIWPKRRGGARLASPLPSNRSHVDDRELIGM